MWADRILEALVWMWPAVFLGRYVFERLALWRGYDGSSAFVERDGTLFDKGYSRFLDSPLRPWPIRCLQQLGWDLSSPLTVLFIAYIVVTLVAAASHENTTGLLFGAALAGVYVWMFVSMQRRNVALRKAERFEATLVSIKGGPVFLGYGRATAGLRNGQTFDTIIRWRAAESLRRRGPVELVLLGSPKEPTVIGMRRAHAP